MSVYYCLFEAEVVKVFDFDFGKRFVIKFKGCTENPDDKVTVKAFNVRSRIDDVNVGDKVLVGIKDSYYENKLYSGIKVILKKVD